MRTAHGVGYCFDVPELELSVSAARFLLWVGEELVQLRVGENIIGRDPAANIVIDSPDVSRQHARLFVTEDHVVIEDLGSKNGTFIDAVPVEKPRVLHAPEEIMIGKTRIQLRMRGSVKSTITTK